MTPDSPLVSALDLHKSFGTHPVLTNLTLTVPAHTFTAILGTSGSGKTTLLRILAGFDRPDSGTITIGGQEVDGPHRHAPPQQRHIGYVSQEGSLFPHMTVDANVGFGLPRSARRGPRVGELLDAVGLTGLGNRYPHQLSGGQQQRVALARALATSPRVVLLDEPFAALDANLRASVRADVKSILSAAGTTTILVTHDQDEALSMADLVGVMRDGTIAQLATPEELYTNPLDRELANFIGDSNLLSGDVQGSHVTTDLGTLPVRAAAGAAAQPGPASILIRPEQIALREPDLPGHVTATVVTTHYHGHDSLVRLQVAPGSGPLITVRLMGDVPPAIGSRVSLVVRGPVLAWCPSGSEARAQAPATSAPHTP